MALHVPKAPGLPTMIKDGAKYFEGVDDAVLSNIEACSDLGKTTRSIFGPSGMKKLVINHIGKLSVTNDAACCLKELEVAHPAAKMLVMVSQEQEQEAGDGTNFVLQFVSSLLENAAELIKMGLSVTEIVEGYEAGCKLAMPVLECLVVEKISDVRDLKQVKYAIQTAIATKQPFDYDFISDLIARACIITYPEKKHFNVDNVRICKITGSGVLQSVVLQGMVFRRETEGDVTKASNCKVAVFSCPLDVLQTETKGTIRIETAEELKNFSKGEENLMEKHIKSFHDVGCSVIVSGGKIGDLALHYANKYGLLLVRLNSKFDVRRLCSAIGATALPRITVPTADECGHVSEVVTEELGGSTVVVFRQSAGEGCIATIVVRGSTTNIMDGVETAIDDGVNTFKCLTKDPRLVPGAGATEIEIARRIKEVADKSPHIDQYLLRKYAQSFEVVPRALAENYGDKASNVISELYARHQEGKQNYGFVIDGDSASVTDAYKAGVVDLFIVKYWAIRFGTSVACKVLRVNQIIMAKPAGGPKPKDNPNYDE